MCFHLPVDWSFDKIVHKGKIFATENYISLAQFIFLEVENGIDVYLTQNGCDYYYLILEGEGYFEVDGKKENCAAGDLAAIPKKKQIYL